LSRKILKLQMAARGALGEDEMKLKLWPNWPFIGLPTAAIVALLAIVLLVPGEARAEEDAKAILKKMTDYVAGQKSFSLDYDSDIEIITPELEKIQFTSSGKMSVSRPDKMRAHRMGGYADVELIFDGKTFTIFGKHANAYVQTESPGSIDDMLGRLRTDYSFEAPGADLLLSNAYEQLVADVLEAKHIGHGVVDGVECDHLAFRNQDTDWQIWVEIGERPIPRKYVITSKAVTGAPQYTLRIKDWKAAEPPADAFAFAPPADAKRAELHDLAHMDEVPPGTVIGESE
jgi:hypothetical protein